MLRFALSLLALVGAASLPACVTVRLWESYDTTSAVVAEPVAVPARVAMAADGCAVEVVVGTTDVADAIAARVSRWEPVDGFADALRYALAASGARTLTVMAFLDDQGAVVERRALLAVAPTGGGRPPLVPLQQATGTDPALAGVVVPCAVTWESRRTSAAGASAFDVAWRVAVTPVAVVADYAILVGALAGFVVMVPVAFVYGVVAGDPTAVEAVGAFLTGR